MQKNIIEIMFAQTVNIVMKHLLFLNTIVVKNVILMEKIFLINIKKVVQRLNLNKRLNKVLKK